MPSAVIVSGARQYRVAPGDVIDVEILDSPPGPVTFDRVLLVENNEDVQVGAPTVDGTAVQATLLGEIKGRKIRIFTYKPKKRRRRRMGHRQRLSRVRIDSIDGVSQDLSAAPQVELTEDSAGTEPTETAGAEPAV